MRKRILTAAVAAATLASGAQAAGFYLKEQSVVGQGRAFAGSAAGTDGASAAYFNPAGTVGVAQQVEVGIHLISPQTEVKDNGTTVTGFPITAAVPGTTLDKQEPYDLSPVPNAHFVKPIDETSSLAISVGAPFGLSNEYDDNYFGRFNNMNASLKSVEVGASYAKAVSEKTSWSLGLMVQSLDLEQETYVGTNGGVYPSASNATLKGDSQDYGYILGFQHKVDEKNTVGFSYRSEVNHTVEGSQTVNTIAGNVQIVNLDVEANYDLPAIAALGIEHKATDNKRYYADVTWYGWSAYETNTIKNKANGSTVGVIRNYYEDTVSIAAGMEYDYSSALTARAGIHYDPTPTVDQYRSLSTPDGDRVWLAGGFSYNADENLTYDMAATYIMVDDGVVNNTNSTGTVTTKAIAEGNTLILSLGLRYKF